MRTHLGTRAAPLAKRSIAVGRSEFQTLLPAMLLTSVVIAAGVLCQPAKAASPPPPGQPLAADVLTVSVSDPEGRPVRKFLVLAGTPSGGVTSQHFVKRTGVEATNWQPHTTHIGRDGVYAWSLKRTYQKMKLRVEAEGFRPAISEWIERGDGKRLLEFKLVRDLGSEHRVLQPDGQPAAGAIVAVALPQKDAVLEEGKLRGLDPPLNEQPGDRWRHPTFVKTDDAGRFRLPPESDPAAAVLVVHDSGVLEMPWTELAAQVELPLRPWGRIEGLVLWHSQVGANEPIHLSIHRDEYGYPGEIAQRAQTVSDAEGRFVFERVLPGRAQISRPTKPKNQGKLGTTTVYFNALTIHPHVKSGEPTQVLLGGRGRTIRGRLTGRDSWEKVSLRMQTDAPPFGFGGDDAMWDAYSVLRQSEIGPLFFREPFAPDVDGSFEIPHLLPGRYELRVMAPGVESIAAYHAFTVEPETAGEAPAALDVGEIKVTSAPAK